MNIEAEPEPEGEGPTFIDKPRIVSENNGKLVIMDCKVKANPKPDILWTREGEVVKESGKCVMTMREKGDMYYIRLELVEPALEDSGLYKCNIKNNLGELNANLTLNIESEFENAKCNKQSNIFQFLNSYSGHQRETENYQNHQKAYRYYRMRGRIQIRTEVYLV